MTTQSPAEFWQGRYAERPHIWSGKPNAALVAALADLSTSATPGRALDLGCGEGADATWLAERGWQVTGVDISATAIERASAQAAACAVPAGRITWIAADLSSWHPTEAFDLVSACFLHSPVEFPRVAVLRRLAGRIVSGGHLLLVGHAEPPPWSRYAEQDAQEADGAHDGEGHHHHFLGPEQEFETLGLGEEWEPLTVELRERPATGPDGEHAVLRDSVVLVRRR